MSVPFNFRAFIVNLANHNTVRVFRIGKKEDGSPGNIAAAIDFPQVLDKFKYFC